ncbi:hypothetical protein Huta_0098 [Halorhabdus utahensis DSM 12940]|uniref:Uncharacterized protein n=1 Tax=Halorhabdus utahensis (strain DSM 12940 / JCM 11049 / AX-2) TaxID=519442 RepID=C7NNZ6_HALUD|nr:hypothetical protein [Halorhabdus utahensis]ACV10287.1 hypothetical protein Huta_0098 [Halorhabdus utahensis DSM 12940]
MTDPSVPAVKRWRYVHEVEEENIEKAVERFRVHVRNVINDLRSQEDASPPYQIEADILVIEMPDSESEVTLLSWGNEKGRYYVTESGDKMSNNKLIYRLKQGDVEERDGEIYVGGEQVVPVDETTGSRELNFDNQEGRSQDGNKEMRLSDFEREE